MWGALATKFPSGENRAHEKSSLSLMLVEQAVFCKVLPICSAIDMNRFPKILSSIGLHLIFLDKCFSFLFIYSILMFFSFVMMQTQSGSITIVLVWLIIKEGPAILVETAKSSKL